MAEIADVLVPIVERTRARVAVDPDHAPTVRLPKKTPAGNAFVEALRNPRRRSVIAEIKMGSPKLGSLAGRFDPERQAETYAKAGAAALSVVVEPDFFGGSYELLRACQRASGLPAIAKDFLVDEIQFYWAFEAGASAVLLIASLCTAKELRGYHRTAQRLGLVPLVETHDQEDAEKLTEAGGDWQLVGVNNRDLRTFEVDLQHSIDQLPHLPEGALKVAESGLSQAEDLERLENAGFDAFLIGESLLLAGDPAAKLRELLGE